MKLQSLIHRLKSGDQKALEIIYDSYSPALLGIIIRIVKSEEIAKDVLQESFIKIWKNSHTYDPSKGAFFTWISRIAKNTALNYIKLKSEKKQRQVTVIDKKHEHIHIQTLNIDVLDMRGNVNHLDNKYKELIELLYFKGYTQQEVADEFDIPLGTIKTRVRKALSKLRIMYTDINHTASERAILILSLFITVL